MHILLSILLVFHVEATGDHNSFFSFGKKEKSEHEQVKEIIEKYCTYVPGSNYVLSSLLSIYEGFDKTRIPLKIFSSVLVVSLTPILILYAIPICHDSVNKGSILYKSLICFAGGSLLGDALLHLIPHTIKDHPDMTHNIGSCIMFGIFLFYTIEKIFALIELSHEHKASNRIATDVIKSNTRKNNDMNMRHSDSSSESCTLHVAQSTAFLNLLADAIHNFMDGMAIAAAYAISTKSGLTTTVSVFLHEIPHEISDFAVLIKSGVSPVKAIFLQLITAIGALSGALITFLLGRVLEVKDPHIIPSITAGGFIYISCVSIIPGVLKDTSSKLHVIIESIAIYTGFYIFTLID